MMLVPSDRIRPSYGNFLSYTTTVLEGVLFVWMGYTLLIDNSYRVGSVLSR